MCISLRGPKNGWIGASFRAFTLVCEFPPLHASLPPPRSLMSRCQDSCKPLPIEQYASIDSSHVVARWVFSSKYLLLSFTPPRIKNRAHYQAISPRFASFMLGHKYVETCLPYSLMQARLYADRERVRKTHDSTDTLMSNKL